MKALILSITAGNGHNIAARAIKEHLEELGVDTVIKDTYKDFTHGMSTTIDKGYLLSTKYAPKLWGTAYSLAEERNDLETDARFGTWGKLLVYRKLRKYVTENKFDVIIATHTAPAGFMTILKEDNVTDAKMYGVITDFTVHPFWEETNLDYYVTASKQLHNMMTKKGISEEKILPFGIPVAKKFESFTPKEAAREQLGLKNKFTVFVIGGSMGFGAVKKHIRNLSASKEDFQIVVVCGNNKKLKEDLEDMNISKDMKVFGFVNNIDLIMDASDCILTKPGGLTVSEALAKNLPLILIDPIPGQEDRNRDFLLNAGFAISTSKKFPSDEAVYQLFTNKERTQQILDMINCSAPKNAGQKLGEFILNEYKNNSSSK